MVSYINLIEWGIFISEQKIRTETENVSKRQSSYQHMTISQILNKHRVLLNLEASVVLFLCNSISLAIEYWYCTIYIILLLMEHVTNNVGSSVIRPSKSTN